ncbi:tRNA uridine-5-carboxymethylaminomethyl(34) synthesis GTPase MnmE [Persicobacter sp. CCB-QB2]|uniref:tRNA uridine-5-carboxymethylaminomethyl(34) synthesis GTPase MnmE n=1 Tax=Persicobacter sp. CCB-QB2 TaxID=1561025 RepID=UPI0006A9E27C|nr:tRNA uridine-5-carboxymethylaminomethyl(34) synthesis GTPase MnmE [Persicobacter sp. CCB-QB2]
MNPIAAMDDTIVALATPQGVGAIAVIRLSGNEAISIVNEVFKGKDLSKQESHTIHFGTIRDGEKILDEVLVSLFIAPKSFTKENVVEISTHGSPFIIKQMIQLFLRKGARLARAGEFTKRAFMNGQFDLAQAEAVADLIHSDSEAAHAAAMNQMRGGFSAEIAALREQLIHFASMIELELDFSEEDVEFADRQQLQGLVDRLQEVIKKLVDSFDLGNVIKNGVPTVIAGKPNAGKSTLLNALLNEEKAIVSDIAGTTRDFIEDEIHLEGLSFRFIDTAGLRETEDKVEAIGVERTREKMKQAAVIIYLFDLAEERLEDIQEEVAKLQEGSIPFIKVGNKMDEAKPEILEALKQEDGWIFISAGQKENLEELKDQLVSKVNMQEIKAGNTVVTNARHYESLIRTQQALDNVTNAIVAQIPGDLMAMDIREALHYLGEISGTVTTDDLLENIFSKFCIGK